MSRKETVWGNYATICRLCLQQDGFLLSIFNNHVNDSNDRSIVKKITECTALELSSGDGLPSCICHRCLYKVELCLEFKQQCLMSDATLRQVNCQAQRERDETTSDMDDEAQYRTTTVSVHQFEQFTHENQKFLTDHGQNVENIVMVVNPDLEYDSDNDSDYEHHSDIENTDNQDLTELRNVFMCKYCDRAYTEREECDAHERSEHNTDAPFMCIQCDMAFADRTNYTAHLKSVHQNDKPFECPQCPRSFSRRSDLRKHTVVHTGIKPFTCNICFKSFSRNTNLTKHLRIHSGHKPYVCPQCPKTFISKGDLTRHALIHSGHKPFTCNYCDQSFGRRDKLVRHEKRHFPNSAEDRSGAANELELLRQQLALSGCYSYEPNIKQEVELEDDVDDEPWAGENMVISVDPFNHEDEQIEKEENSDSNPDDVSNDLPKIPDQMETPELPQLPEHITADDPYPESDLKKKINTINAIKKYLCFVCHKRFASAESLRFHSVSHTSHKPYTCSECSKSFLRKRELDRHMTTHTGMKPFKCPNCDKKFGRKDKLGRHMRIHNTSNSHTCLACGARFARKDSLVTHMRIHISPDVTIERRD